MPEHINRHHDHYTTLLGHALEGLLREDAENWPVDEIGSRAVALADATWRARERAVCRDRKRKVQLRPAEARYGFAGGGDL